MTNSGIRDLHVLRASDISAVQKAVSDIWHAWCKEWLPSNTAPVEMSVGSLPSRSSCEDAATWSGWARQGDKPQSWVATPASSANALACLLIGRDSTAPLPANDWALDAAQKAQCDLLERLLGQQVADQSEPPVTHTLSGDLYIDVAALGWHMRLGFAAFQMWCTRKPADALPSAAMRSLSKALQKSTVKVAVQLKGIELAVNDLQGLSTGDVIRLPVALTEDLTVECAAGTSSVPVSATLGQLAQHLGIQWHAA